MLSCREVTRRASDYVDRELPLHERLAVWFHLLMCVKCRRLIRHVRYLVAALRKRLETAARTVDAAYVDRVVARLPAAGENSREPDRTP